MEILKVILWVMQIISAITIVVLVLLQQGKGAEAGATLGSGGSSSLFGASGSANFLSRATAVAATVFFLTTIFSVMSMTYSSNNAGVMSGLNGKAVASTPAVSTTSSAPAKSVVKASSVIPE